MIVIHDLMIEHKPDAWLVCELGGVKGGKYYTPHDSYSIQTCTNAENTHAKGMGISY